MPKDIELCDVNHVIDVEKLKKYRSNSSIIRTRLFKRAYYFLSFNCLQVIFMREANFSALTVSKFCSRFQWLEIASREISLIQICYILLRTNKDKQFLKKMISHNEDFQHLPLSTAFKIILSSNLNYYEKKIINYAIFVKENEFFNFNENNILFIYYHCIWRMMALINYNFSKKTILSFRDSVKLIKCKKLDKLSKHWVHSFRNANKFVHGSNLFIVIQIKFYIDNVPQHFSNWS